jgi:hypothetical protein
VSRGLGVVVDALGPHRHDGEHERESSRGALRSRRVERSLTPRKGLPTLGFRRAPC